MPDEATKKRLLILTADAGFGHRSAANAVAAAAQELYGDRCQVSIINPLDERFTPLFLRESQTDYDKFVRRLPELYRLGFDASDAVIPATIVEQALILLLFEAMRDLLRAHQPDAILTTYPLYQAPLRAALTVSRSNIPLLVTVTDLATVHRLWFSSSCDLVLVPTEGVRDVALNYGLGPARVQVTGIPVNPEITKELRSPQEIRQELGWETQLPTVLAIGSRRVDRLVDALAVLNHFGRRLQLVMVAGKDENLYNELKSIEWHMPVQLFKFVNNIPTFMKAADFVVCKAGGLVVTEALACARPLLLIDAIPGQETGNADYVAHNGAGVLALNPMEVLETTAHWFMNDSELLHRSAENARRLGRPNAAYEVANCLWQAAQQKHVSPGKPHTTGRYRLIDLLKRHQIRLDDE